MTLPTSASSAAAGIEAAVVTTSMTKLLLEQTEGEYRFNDLDLGDIDGIPRLLDIGQISSLGRRFLPS